MAKFTSDGHVRYSGDGMTGLHAAWNEVGATVTQDLPDLWKRAIQVRGDIPGGGGGTHGQKWEDGWFAGRNNATAAVEKATGFPHAKPDPVPRAGTKERAGYDAAQAAALLAVLAIHPD